MARKLRKYNSKIMFRCDRSGKQFEGNRGQLQVYVAAYSQKDLQALLESYGHHPSMYEIRGWWVIGHWGNVMDGIEPMHRGMWVHYNDGELPRFIKPGTSVY